MPTSPSAGFGTGPFGTMPFGTALSPSATLVIESILALRENMFQVAFNVPPRFTQLRDPNDASDPRRYVARLVPGTGRDGNPAKPVRVIMVEQEPGTDGAVLNLWLDRPMSPEPCQYDLTISGLVSATGYIPLDPVTERVIAVFKGIVPLIPEFIINNRDLSNPQSRHGIFDPLPVEEGQNLDKLLGTYPSDSQGDVAFDEGLAGVRKRVMRRLTTRKGKFAHLPNYGVSTIASIKQLSRAGLREFLAEEAEQQIRQEPEVVDVSVVIVVDESRPDMARYQVRVRTNFGQMPNLDVPISFSPTGL